MNRLHRGVLSLFGGRVLGSFSGMPVVELYTTGRKTGQRRMTMLTSPIHDDTRVVLVASRGGDDRDPAWLLNLTANPSVEVAFVGHAPAPYQARVATPTEKASIWPEIVSVYKGYAGYQKRTDRDIPVVICEPAS